MNLIEKTHTTVTRKPAFRWLGLKGKTWNEALLYNSKQNESRKRAFGNDVTNSSFAYCYNNMVVFIVGSSKILSSLDHKKPLLEQLENAFSIKESPIWMDCSTTAECRAIENAFGGALELAKVTGSRAYERFTGPQIKKIFDHQPEIYNNTERISLVSSFMASLFISAYAAIDHSDGACMNLMDIKEKAWSKVALEATATDLESKLGNLAPAYGVAGNIASYFVERYNFNKDCLVI
ncbi:E2F transcription factor E2FE [Trifolium repens]|nr:E2F transcription factor E2FE [Trifolium repens]